VGGGVLHVGGRANPGFQLGLAAFGVEGAGELVSGYGGSTVRTSVACSIHFFCVSEIPSVQNRAGRAISGPAWIETIQSNMRFDM
jgi:hypothetical protein